MTSSKISIAAIIRPQAIRFVSLGLCVSLAVFGSPAVSASMLRLKTGDIDTSKFNVHLQSLPSDNLLLVQYGRTITQADTTALTNTGSVILSYIPDNTYLVKTTAGGLSELRSLSGVEWVGAYSADYRISPDIPNTDATVVVSALLTPTQNSKKIVSSLASNIKVVAISDSSLVLSCSGKTARSIARSPWIRWIEPKVQPKLSNDVARSLMHVANVWNDSNLFGEGQTVAVCDTGLDVGATSLNLSEDFKGRVVAAFDLGRVGLTNDPNGHGTHVAGSVLGSGVSSGSNPITHSYSGSLAGVAPEASLVFQSILDSSDGLNGLPNDLGDLFSQAYAAGARIHTNSWGAATAGAYDFGASELDGFTWANRDMVILCAAGNEGVDSDADGVIDTGSLSSPSTAKNCISVGASESLRNSGGYQFPWSTASWASYYPADPIKSDYLSDNPSGIAAFSSRGPTQDGRFKPDIVAPGTNIVSTRSHVSGATTGWGTYNSDYIYMGGTSMATPLAAGAATLARQFYTDVKQTTPSSALVKATIMATATDLTPGQYGTGFTQEIPARPNNVEGWGRVDLKAAITPDSPNVIEFVDEKTGLNSGQILSYNYPVVNTSVPLRIMLCWTDYPGDPIASKALVNDLDLRVQSPSGAVYTGNGQLDRTNNVEGIDIASPELGTYTVTISAYSIPRGPQPFALALYGGFAQGLIAGNVLTANNSPISGCQITAIGQNGQFVASSNDNGRYQIHLPEGTYTVSAAKSDWTFTPLPSEVVVASDNSQVVNFVGQAPPASVTGHVYSMTTTATAGLWESAHPYGNNSLESFTVMGVSGAVRVRLHFAQFETESSYDTVTVRDSTGKIVADYSGTLDPFWTPWIDGTTANITLKSDFNISFYGFRIDFCESAVAGAGLPGVTVKHTLSGLSTLTAQDGSYTFQSVEPVSSSLVATFPSMVMWPPSLTVSPSPGEALIAPGFVASPEYPIVHIRVKHGYVGDLVVTVGAGDEQNPIWSRTLSNRAGGSQTSLNFDIPIDDEAPGWPPSQNTPWFVKVCDDANYDTGTLDAFSVSKGTTTYWATDLPAAINDLQCVTRKIPAQNSLSIGAAKQLPDGARCFLGNKIVTGDFGDRFYIEEADFSSGIAVISPLTVNPGDVVSILGTIGTSGCERVIYSAQVYVNTSGGANTRPLWMPCKILGGSPLNELNPGFTDNPDLSNLGMLVRVAGTVTATDPEYFYINDGSARPDPGGFSGVRVILPPDATAPPVGSQIAVVGISSCKDNGFGNARVLYPRSTLDITEP